MTEFAAFVRSNHRAEIKKLRTALRRLRAQADLFCAERGLGAERWFKKCLFSFLNAACVEVLDTRLGTYIDRKSKRVTISGGLSSYTWNRLLYSDLSSAVSTLYEMIGRRRR